MCGQMRYFRGVPDRCHHQTHVCAGQPDELLHQKELLHPLQQTAGRSSELIQR